MSLYIGTEVKAMTSFGKLCYKTCREQAGLTQEQAIRLLGIAEVSTLSRYENGHAPVSQDMVAAMIKAYRIPALAKWHVVNANPDLVSYLRMADNPLTDGDAMLQLELAEDSLADERTLLKSILRNGKVSVDEADKKDVIVNSLRDISRLILSAANYLEQREVGGGD